MTAQNALASINTMEKQTNMGCKIIENDTRNYLLSTKINNGKKHNTGGVMIPP
jgi:hypothetical protein